MTANGAESIDQGSRLKPSFSHKL
ncbi:hypothetical protein BVIET440_250018 [Burkholderia vietnamiensis]